MPITRCPGCQANLEVPAVVPTGMVECPYCETEFAVKKGGGSRGRRGARAPADDYGYEDDGGYRGRRRRTDPVPIIILSVSAVVLIGLGIFFFVKHGQGKSASEQAFLDSMRSKDEALYLVNRPADQPQGDAIPMKNDFLLKDMLTIMDFTYTSGLNVRDNQGQSVDIFGTAYQMRTEEHGENIVAAEADGTTTHEGRYEIKSFMINGKPVVSGSAWLDARFRTDRFGTPIAGSFERIGGAVVQPSPEWLADRGFAVLPDRPVRYMETWGGEKLGNPFLAHVNIDGLGLEQIPLISPGRSGGWRVQKGTFEKEADGSWSRAAFAEIHLSAWENRRLDRTRGGKYHGEPADITAAVRWIGDAKYELRKNYLSEIKNTKCEIWIVVKTDRAWWEWKGIASTAYQMYKDP